MQAILYDNLSTHWLKFAVPGDANLPSLLITYRSGYTTYRVAVQYKTSVPPEI